MRKLILGAFLLALLAGCSTNPQQTAPVEERSSTTTPGGGAGTGTTTGGATGTGVGGNTTTSPGGAGGTASSANPLRDPNNILSKRSVYFDYDSFAVKDEFRGVVEA